MVLYPEELRKMSLEELKKKLKELRAELLKQRIQVKMGTQKNVKIIRNTRKDIARILTELRNRQIKGEKVEEKVP
jgi:large subunit ribosomal protein L29